MLFQLGRHVLRSNLEMGLDRADGEMPAASLCIHEGASVGTDEALGFGAEAAHWHHAFEWEHGGVWLEAGATHDGYLLRYPDLVDFHLSDVGRRVDAYPHASTPPTTVRHLFLAQVWPVLLSLRGDVVLHASAVRLGDHAVAFVGNTGRGKSTLAASFNRQGYALVTDDILLLDRQGDVVYAVPSYPEQRLWSDSAEALTDAPQSLRNVAHYTDKKALHLPLEDRSFEKQPVPLAAIFTLDVAGEGEGVTIEPLPLSEAYIALLDQVFRLDFSDRTRMQLEVEQLTDLVHAVPVLRLAYPRRYEALDRVHRAVFDAVGAIYSTESARPDRTG